MPIFTLDQLRALAASYATLQERLDTIATAYASFPYKTLRTSFKSVCAALSARYSFKTWPIRSGAECLVLSVMAGTPEAERLAIVPFPESRASLRSSGLA
jgi:hypothetical protein